MTKLIRCIKILFWIIAALLIVNLVYPEVLSKYYTRYLTLTESQWNIILLGIEIVIQLLIAVISACDQNEERQKCQYQFDIADETVCFDEYVAFEGVQAKSHTYVFKGQSGEIQTPYHGISMPFSREEYAKVSFPLVLTVQKCPDGESLRIKNVLVSAKKNGRIIKWRKTINPHCTINSPITNGKKYLLRISLLCDYRMERRLLKGRYSISMKLILCDCRGQKHKKHIIIEIQNVNDKQIIKQVVSHNRLLPYLLARIKIMVSRLVRSRNMVNRGF